jgi:ribosomal protein S27E
MRRRLSQLWLLLLLLSVAALAQNRAVGKQACASCHAAEQKTVAGTPHEIGRSCEACHGPGELHVKSPQDPSTIFSFARASADQVRSRCGQCHANPVMQNHAQGDVSCLACHSSHHYLKRKYLLKPKGDPLEHPA